MGGHTVHPRNVPSDERVPRAHSLHTTVRTVRSCQLLHVDREGEELSADDY